MIDIDKYEGHTEGEWEWWNDYIRDTSENELHIAKMEYDYKSADAQLIADAPLLLAEVNRLREELINVQRSLIWDEKDRAMFDEPITLEALFTQVEQVRSDITEMIK